METRPVIVGLRAVGHRRAAGIEILAEHAIRTVRTRARTNLRGAERIDLRSAACGGQTARGVFRRLRKNADNTPLTAFAPQTDPPGPRMISMRSMFSSGISRCSQYTPENAGVYTVRPSISTSTLFEYRALNPRTLIAHALASICSTLTPGAMRSRSGMLVAPERRMSSELITKTAAAVCDRALLALRHRSDADVHQIFHVEAAEVGRCGSLGGPGGEGRENESKQTNARDDRSIHRQHIDRPSRLY